MNEWKALAIVGIWLGVGLSAFQAKEGAIGVAFFAMLATIVIASK